MRILILAATALLSMPGVAAAQNRSPFPDHWLTLDSLGTILGLSPEQRAIVGDSYESVNESLRQATQRREELRVTLGAGGPVAQMTPEQRQELTARLVTVRVEYEARQGELESRLAALRALLTPDQQARFDGLEKPRLVPEPSAAPSSR